jgi:hypothetical protein
MPAWRASARSRKRTREPHFPPAYLAVLLKPLCGNKDVWRSPVTINGESSVGIAEAHHRGRLFGRHLRSDFVAKNGFGDDTVLVNDGHFGRQQTPADPQSAFVLVVSNQGYTGRSPKMEARRHGARFGRGCGRGIRPRIRDVLPTKRCDQQGSDGSHLSANCFVQTTITRDSPDATGAL